MKTSAPQSPGGSTPAPKRRSSIWIVVNLLLVAAVWYMLHNKHAPEEEASPPSPGPAVSSTPFPAAPLPAAIPSVAPATPEPLVALSQVDRRALPSQVTLVKPVDFALYSQGRPIGSAHAGAGVQVDLVRVVSDSEIEVRMGDSLETIPASSTDIETRVRTLVKPR